MQLALIDSTFEQGNEAIQVSIDLVVGKKSDIPGYIIYITDNANHQSRVSKEIQQLDQSVDVVQDFAYKFKTPNFPTLELAGWLGNLIGQLMNLDDSNPYIR